MPIQIVGTPAVTVTCSDSSRSSRAAGARSGPGITSDAPAIIAACPRPQALAWNIGTTGRILSDSDSENTADVSVANECSQVERCEYSTPFGLPVVPVV